MNAATFRAIRETCGLSQLSVADYNGVSVRAVKMWEGGKRRVPEAVAAWLTGRLDDHNRVVRDWLAAEEYEAEGAKIGGEPLDAIRIPYYRDVLGSNSMAVANANARAVAAKLRDDGYEVYFAYQGEADGSS